MLPAFNFPNPGIFSLKSQLYMEKLSTAQRKISLSHFLVVLVFIFCAVFVQSEAKETEKRSCNCRGDACYHTIGKIGGVIDERSRIGKEQKIAIQMAIEGYTGKLEIENCSKLALYIEDSYGKSARAASAVKLVKNEKVQAIVGALTMEEATLVTQFEEVNNSNTPIITIGLAAISPSPVLFHQPPSIFQMNDDIYTRMRCAAEIIGHFRWQRVTVIYEQSNSFYSDLRLKSELSESLKPFDSFVESDMAFPSLSSLQEPQAFIQESLKKLKSKNSVIFVLLQSSIEFATILLENAKKLGLMEKGYAWILCDDVVNLLDSLEPSSRRSMQGIIGFRTNIIKKRRSFQQFKSKFQSRFRLAYPEEEHSTPSTYALRAYDAATVMEKSMQALEGNMNSSELISHISVTNFEGLSGKISFKNGKLSKNTTFQIINVIGKRYRPIGFWSQEHGFSRNFTHDKRKGNEKIGNDSLGELASIYWPGGEQKAPKGSVLRIGVPAMAAFHQFVDIEYDQVQKPISFGGLAVEVFEAAVKMLPYHLSYRFVPFNGTYDEIVIAVSNKTLDAAVGDINVLEHRYQLADFTLPYLDNQIVMVTPEQKDLKGQRFIILDAFERKLWVVLAALSQCTAAIIYFNERVNGNTEFAHPFPEMIGAIVWLSITLLSFAHREAIKSCLSRSVLAVWLSVIVVVAASFTAVLSSMMTVPRLKPAIVDIEYLKSTNATVGCNGKGFILKYLQQTLAFNAENIKRIDSYKDYPKAFESGQIAAAFLISPHARVFVAKNKRFVMAKPSFEVGGLSFVLPKGSHLTRGISKAILNMKENGVINQMEQHILSLPPLSSSSKPDDKLSLSLEQFSGPLMVSGAIDAIGLCVIIAHLGKGWQFHGYIYSWLTQKGFWRWASFLLAKSHVGFGSRFFTAHIVDRQNNNQMNIV